MLGGLLAAALAALVGGLAVLVLRQPGTQPELDVPAEGDDLLAWAAANPDLTHCPDTPAEEGL